MIAWPWPKMPDAFLRYHARSAASRRSQQLASNIYNGARIANLFVLGSIIALTGHALAFTPRADKSSQAILATSIAVVSRPQHMF